MTEVTDRFEEARPRCFWLYPEYRTSGVEWLGEIPASWDVQPLKHLATFSTGWTPPTGRKDLDGGEHLWGERQRSWSEGELPREVQQNIDVESFRIQQTSRGRIALKRKVRPLEPAGSKSRGGPGAVVRPAWHTYDAGTCDCPTMVGRLRPSTRGTRIPSPTRKAPTLKRFDKRPSPICTAALAIVTRVLASSVLLALGDVDAIRQAGNQCDAEAQFDLGLMYEVGRDLPQDDAEAVRSYLLAAGQGHAYAQHNLAVSYAMGEGVPPDPVLAHMWFIISGSTGNDTAVEPRRLLGSLMTQDEIRRTYELALAYIASNYQNCQP